MEKHLARPIETFWWSVPLPSNSTPNKTEIRQQPSGGSWAAFAGEERFYGEVSCPPIAPDLTTVYLCWMGFGTGDNKRGRQN